MAYDKTAFIGAHAVPALAVQFLLKSANNRGQVCMNAMAQFGGTTTEPPLSTAQMAQTYTFADAADVETFLQSPGVGIRGSEFLQTLGHAATPGAAVIDTAGPATTVAFTLAGFFPMGTSIVITVSAGEVPDVRVFTYLTTRDQLFPTASQGCADLLIGDPDLEATADPETGTVTIESEFNVTISGVVINLPTMALNPAVTSPAPNVYDLQNDWPAGSTCEVTLRLTDSVGDVTQQVVPVTLPSDMTAAQAAAYIAIDLDALAFVDALAIGATVSLSATEPGTTLESSATVV